MRAQVLRTGGNISVIYSLPEWIITTRQPIPGKMGNRPLQNNIQQQKKKHQEECDESYHDVGH
jgi:hypothetical protein